MGHRQHRAQIHPFGLFGCVLHGLHICHMLQNNCQTYFKKCKQQTTGSTRAKEIKVSKTFKMLKVFKLCQVPKIRLRCFFVQ